MRIQRIVKNQIVSLIRLLCISLTILLTYSCVGQVSKSELNEKVKNSNKPQKEIQLPLIYKQEKIDSKQHSTFNGIISEFVWQMYQDKNNRFWFCTNHDGVIIYNGKSLKQYTPKNGLGGNAVRSIIEDSTGNIWLGTSNGLTKYNGEIFTNYSLGNSLDNNEIWAIAIDKGQNIWIGSVGGVSMFDGEKFTSFTVPKADIKNATPMLSENSINDILIDKNENIWFVIDGYGISKFNGKTFEFYSKENGLTDNNVADIFEDSKGNIWIGTYYGGVSKYDGKTFTNYTKDGIIKGIETYNFCEDNQGNIWFSTENHGVYRYNGKEFRQFTMKDGLATNTIQSIFQDKKGQIWFSTWDGLSLYDGKQIMNASDNEPWME